MDSLTWFNIYSKQTPLELALAGGHTDTAKLLVKWGAKVDLASAAELGLASVIKNAIRADPACVNSRFSTASWRYLPRDRGYTFGPGANCQNGTLLHFAVWGGQRKMIQLLLQSGADKMAMDDEGRTPYQLAQVIGQTGLGELLR
jgi:ankyrin repeat protein